jgi:hypothetical protein
MHNNIESQVPSKTSDCQTIEELIELKKKTETQCTLIRQSIKLIAYENYEKLLANAERLSQLEGKLCELEGHLGNFNNFHQA